MTTTTSSTDAPRPPVVESVPIMGPLLPFLGDVLPFLARTRATYGDTSG